MVMLRMFVGQDAILPPVYDNATYHSSLWKATSATWRQYVQVDRWRREQGQLDPQLARGTQ
jgi:hypothetical protein